MDGTTTTLRIDGRGGRVAARRSGMALVEAIVSCSIFLLLVGSVAYASRVALSVMTDSMKETKLLFRVRRALDHAEEQLGRACRVSVVTLTDDGWTVAGLENWFEQLAHQNEGEPVAEDAEQVRAELEETERALSKPTPDYPSALDRMDDAITKFDEMVGAGMIDAGDAPRLRDALQRVLNNVIGHAIVSLGGGGRGILDAWQPIEQAIADRDSLFAAEPLVSADQVLFREYVIGGAGPEYRPPLDLPPFSYYLRPTAGGEQELVFFNGTQSVVIAEHLTGVQFVVQGHTLTITLRFMEERNGAMIERTEVRSVQLRVG